MKNTRSFCSCLDKFNFLFFPMRDKFLLNDIRFFLLILILVHPLIGFAHEIIE